MVFKKKNVVLLYNQISSDNLMVMVKELEKYLNLFKDEFEFIAVECGQYMPKYSYKSSTKFNEIVNKNAYWLSILDSKFKEKVKIVKFKKDLKKPLPEYNTEYTDNVKELQVKDEEEEKTKKKKMLNIAPAISTKTLVNNIIKRFSPSMIICTHPDAMKISLDVKYSHNYSDLKVIGANLSLGSDMRFLDIRADGYFVLNDITKKEFVKTGINEDIISIIGIPMKQIADIDQKELRGLFDIDNDLPVVLLDCGEYGTTGMIDYFYKLADSDVEYNLLILHGGNVKISTLIKSKINSSKRVIKLVEEEQRNDAILLAKVFITKPITGNIFQAMLSNTAIVTTKPYSMLHKHNNDFLRKCKFVRTSVNSNSLLIQVCELILEEKQFEQIMRNEKIYLQEFGEIKIQKYIEGYKK